MALNPSNSSNLEQLALKGLMSPASKAYLFYRVGFVRNRHPLKQELVEFYAIVT